MVATPHENQDSSLSSVLAYSQALIVRAENAPPTPAGAPVRVIRLD